MSYRRSMIKTIQTGSITMNGVTSNTATLGTTVDKNYSTIELTAVADVSGSGDPSINACRVQLTNGTTVTAFVNTAEAANKIVYFTVTEWFPFCMLQTVQHLSFTTSTQSITTVGAKAMLFYGGFTTTDTSAGRVGNALGGAELTSTTVVTGRGNAIGSGTVACCVADFK